MKRFSTKLKNAEIFTRQCQKYSELHITLENAIWSGAPITTKEQLLIKLAGHFEKTKEEVIALQDSTANIFPRLICTRKEVLHAYHEATNNKFKEIIRFHEGFGDDNCKVFSYLGELKSIFNLVKVMQETTKTVEPLILFDDSVTNMKKIELYNTKPTAIQAAPDGYSPYLHSYIDIKGGQVRLNHSGEVYTINFENGAPSDILNTTDPQLLAQYKRSLGYTLSLYSDNFLKESISKINAIKEPLPETQLKKIFGILADVHVHLNNKGMPGQIIQKKLAATIILPLLGDNDVHYFHNYEKIKELTSFLKTYPLDSKAAREAFFKKSISLKTKDELDKILESLDLSSSNLESDDWYVKFMIPEIVKYMKASK